MVMLQVSSNEETIDNLDKQLADSKITLSDSENKFDDISRKLVKITFEITVWEIFGTEPYLP